ncbi:MAG: hypothetical protein MIO93_04505 [ANME-2 cluster archaeon]|nr:hypothetical protein [ANME-2 cluster archaeon]
MLDANILKLMFKEEFRLQASFFNRSYFLTSSLVLVLFTFIMGLSLPMLRRAIEIDDMLLVTHWVMLFYGLGVGGFALFGERILERRFGSISLLLGSGYTLPIRHRRLFFLFYIKDILYYILLTILPMVVGLALASVFVSISLTSLLVLFISLTLSFLLGISTSVLLFTISVRWGTPPILILSAAAGTYLVADGFTVSSISRALPPLVFYHTHYPFIMVVILAVVILFAAISFLLVKEAPSPHERSSHETYRKVVRQVRKLVSGYAPALAKDIIDLMRSGMIFPVVFTFLMPLVFLYAVTWFIESVMLIDLGFSLLFYAGMVGFFCTLLYSWLSNIDISECYNSLPLSMPHVIRTKLILFFTLTVIVAVPYLIAVGYLKHELDLLVLGLFIMLTVSTYIGSVVAYLTGLFTNSYLLDARILLQFTLAVVPVLVIQTLLSFYYQINSSTAAFYIAGLGILLLAASVLLLGKLDKRWMSTIFRIA